MFANTSFDARRTTFTADVEIEQRGWQSRCLHRRLAAVAAHVGAQPVLDPDVIAAAATVQPTQGFIGNSQQGFGIRAQKPPPVFNPCTQHAEAFEFWQENRYVVVQALSASEVREMNQIADHGWLRDYAHVPSETMVFYPLIDYPAVDKFINHANTMPLISEMLGGWEHVRFQEFNWRYYPENYGAPADGVPPPGSFGMRFHPDASLPDRFWRQPYGPPDYVSAFYYLTDTHPRTPCFCVVPKSTRFRTLEEARDVLGDDYVETPIYGKAGTAIIVDTAIFHTRLDGDGKAGRRIMHHAYARGGWLRLQDTDGWRAPSPVNNPNNLFPQRLVEHPDAEMRRFMCLWSATQCEWVASGYDEEYRSHRPTKGSPDPAQSRHSR